MLAGMLVCLLGKGHPRRVPLFPSCCLVCEADHARVVGDARAARLRRALHAALGPAADGDLSGAHHFLDPMGRSSSMSASILPSSPVVSSTKDTGVTSTTRARKMSAVLKISAR